MLHEGVAQPLDRGPLVLHPDLERVDRLPHVRHGDVPDDGHVAGLLVDLGLDGRAVELEERRAAAQRMVRIRILAHLAVPDQLAAEQAQTWRENVDDGDLAAGQAHDAALDDDLGLIEPVEPGRHRAELGLDATTGEQDGVAHQDG